MARLLVTGGAGFIGSNFIHHWLATHPGERLIALDALTYAGNFSNLKSVQHQDGFRFVHADIRDSVFVEEKWVPFFKTGKELRERLNPGMNDNNNGEDD